MKTSRILLLFIASLMTFSIPFAIAGNVERAVVCGDLDQQNQPVDIDTVFSTEINKLVIWAEFKELSGGDEIQFDFVVPGYQTVYISPTKGLASSADTYTAWAVVPTTNLNLQPGMYVANVYLNGMSAKQVSIQLAGGTTPPIPYMIMNGIDAPEQVSPGEDFTITVYTEYHFNQDTQVSPTIFDPQTESVLAVLSATLGGKDNRGFTFEVTAPEGNGEYFLYAVNYFQSGGDLTYNENGGIETIVLQLGEGGTGSNLSVDPAQIRELVPDDITLDELTDLIPDAIKGGIDDVEEAVKGNGVPGFPIEVIALTLVAFLVYSRRS